MRVYYCDIICLLFHLVPLLDHTSTKGSYTVTMKRCNLFSLFHLYQVQISFEPTVLCVGELRPNSVFRLNMQGVYQCYNFYHIPYIFLKYFSLFCIVSSLDYCTCFGNPHLNTVYAFPICDFNLYGDVL